MKEWYTWMHLAKRFEYETDLFTTRHKNEGLRLKVTFDETPENIEFLVERAYRVMLLQRFRGICF